MSTSDNQNLKAVQQWEKRLAAKAKENGGPI